MSYGWDNDDVFLGESLRGMQDEDYMGNIEIGAAAQQLAALRGRRPQGALGQMAAQRFNRFAPLQRVVRPAYKDSTQISIKCSGSFTPSNWSGSSSLPTVNGSTRVFESFKPNKAIVSLLVKATFTNDSDVSVTRSAVSDPPADIVLVSAFSGAKNCFPNAPNEDNGINGVAFAQNSLGNGISWPTINGGIDMVVTWAIEDTVQYLVDPPSGYTQDDLASVQVIIRFGLFGPSLRP